MSLPSYYDTGTASVANGATTITFSGALMGTAQFPNIEAGDQFLDPAQPLVPPQRIASVDYVASTAELSVNWPGITMSSAAYEVRFIGDTVRSTAQTRRLLEQLSVVQANGRGLFLIFDDTTTDSDPGSGKIRLNNATIGSATAAYIDNLDADGATISALLDTWDDAGSTDGRGQFWLRSIATPSTFHAFDVTGSVVDGTGYRKLTLEYIGGSGSLAADDELMVMFLPKGGNGEPGADGNDGTNGADGETSGQCRLTKVSTDLVLSPFDGNKLRIGGNLEAVPDSGVSLAPTGLAASTLYYIYAYMNSGTMTLEASTTAPAFSTTAGNKGTRIKTGDDTRTLVGMARPIAGPAWEDSATRRFVRSYFNRQRRALRNAFTNDRTTTSTSFVELNSEIRCEFLIWADEAVRAAVNGPVICASATPAYIWTSVGFDGTTNEGQTMFFASNSVTFMAGYSQSKDGLAEGYHYCTVLGQVTAQTGQWGDGASRAVSLNVDIG